MKNLLLKLKGLIFLSSLFLFIFLLRPGYGEWMPIENVSNDPFLSGRPAIAIDGNDMAHIVWVGKVAGINEIIYIGQDMSENWKRPVNISHTDTRSARPAIAAGYDNVVHVTWRDERDEFTDIFYNVADNNGWKIPLNISKTDAVSFKSVISVGLLGIPHVIWEEGIFVLGSMQIAYSYLDGINWTEPINISRAQRCAWPAIASGNDYFDIKAVWGVYDDMELSASEIIFRETASFFSSPANVSRSPGPSERPSIAVDSIGNIHVVWRDKVIPCVEGERCEQEGVDYYPGKGNIYYSVRDADVWSDPAIVVHTPVDSARPSIAVDSMDNIHVVWQDSSFYIMEILYSSRVDGQWTPVENISDSENDSWIPSIAIDSADRIYVVWEENVDDNREIFLRKNLIP